MCAHFSRLVNVVAIISCNNSFFNTALFFEFSFQITWVLQCCILFSLLLLLLCATFHVRRMKLLVVSDKDTCLTGSSQQNNQVP